MHELTFLETARQRIATETHDLVSPFGLYAERDVPDKQYTATVVAPYEELEQDLSNAGFIRNLPSPLKSRNYATPDEVQVATWAWFPNGLLRSNWMLDLELFVGPDDRTTDVYAHWEPSWFRHPIRHYRANEVNSEKGVIKAIDVFDEHNINYVVCGVDERYTPGVTGCTVP